MGSLIKQLVLMTLLINCFWPIGLQPTWFGFGALIGIGWLIAKLLLLSCAIVLLETVKRQDAALPCTGVARRSFHSRFAGPRFHVSLLMIMRPVFWICNSANESSF